MPTISFISPNNPVSPQWYILDPSSKVIKKLAAVPPGTVSSTISISEECLASSIVNLIFLKIKEPPILTLIFLIPCFAKKSEISWIQAIGALVLLEISKASPKWSEWPWVIKIISGFNSSTGTSQAGLLLINGSIKILTPSSLIISKVECPNHLISIIRYHQMHDSLIYYHPN